MPWRTLRPSSARPWRRCSRRSSPRKARPRPKPSGTPSRSRGLRGATGATVPVHRCEKSRTSSAPSWTPRAFAIVALVAPSVRARWATVRAWRRRDMAHRARLHGGSARSYAAPPGPRSVSNCPPDSLPLRGPARTPARALDPDRVDKPARTGEPRDQAAHRRRRVRRENSAPRCFLARLTPKRRGHHRSGGLRGPAGATVPLHRRGDHARDQRRMDRRAPIHEP